MGYRGAHGNRAVASAGPTVPGTYWNNRSPDTQAVSRVHVTRIRRVEVLAAEAPQPIRCCFAPVLAQRGERRSRGGISG